MTQPKINYLRAKKSDAAAIISLLSGLNGDRDDFNSDRFYVAKDGVLIVGCIRTKVYSGDCLELASLAVDEKYQRQGIGSHLVQFLLADEKERPIFLLTSADKELYYQKFGFIRVSVPELPADYKKEYEKIINLPFAQNLEVIAMRVG